MTSEEHLIKIVTKCRQLLVGAERRTEGKWIHYYEDGSVGSVVTPDLDAVAQTQERVDVMNQRGRLAQVGQRNNNAAFVASCAGPAEAGWRTTIANCEFIIAYNKISFGWDGDCGASRLVDDLESRIIASWPEELL